MWPVDAVVGENGAVYMIHDDRLRKLRKRYAASESERRAARARLKEIGKRIVAGVPGCAPASDQPYRESDLAIDYCEDVAPLPLETAVRIAALMRAEGLSAKVSSIHVNGWFGSYDKLAMSKRLFTEFFRIPADMLRQEL